MDAFQSFIDHCVDMDVIPIHTKVYPHWNHANQNLQASGPRLLHIYMRLTILTVKHANVSELLCEIINGFPITQANSPQC